MSVEQVEDDGTEAEIARRQLEASIQPALQAVEQAKTG